MKNLLSKKFNSHKPSGFTLVELLVVIGILGILAAGLLATIDPLEQFRRGSDSNRRSTSLELVNAITRYYANRQAYPWDAVASGGEACNGAAAPSALAVSGLTAASAFGTCLTALTSEGELKATFETQYAILNKLLVTQSGEGENTSVAVCFNPESKNLSRGDQAIYNTTGDTSTDCDTVADRETNTDSCYICVK